MRNGIRPGVGVVHVAQHLGIGAAAQDVDVGQRPQRVERDARRADEDERDVRQSAGDVGRAAARRTSRRWRRHTSARGCGMGRRSSGSVADAEEVVEFAAIGDVDHGARMAGLDLRGQAVSGISDEIDAAQQFLLAPQHRGSHAGKAGEVVGDAHQRFGRPNRVEPEALVDRVDNEQVGAVEAEADEAAGPQVGQRELLPVVEYPLPAQQGEIEMRQQARMACSKGDGRRDRGSRPAARCGHVHGCRAASIP